MVSEIRIEYLTATGIFGLLIADVHDYFDLEEGEVATLDSCQKFSHTYLFLENQIGKIRWVITQITDSDRRSVRKETVSEMGAMVEILEYLKEELTFWELIIDTRNPDRDSNINILRIKKSDKDGMCVIHRHVYISGNGTERESEIEVEWPTT